MFSIKYSKQFLSYRILKSNRFKYIWRYGLGLDRGCAQGGVCVYRIANGLSYLRCSGRQRGSCPSKTWKVLYSSPMAGTLFIATRAWESTSTATATTTATTWQTRCHRKSLVRRIFRGQGVIRVWGKKKKNYCERNWIDNNVRFPLPRRDFYQKQSIKIWKTNVCEGSTKAEKKIQLIANHFVDRKPWGR